MEAVSARPSGVPLIAARARRPEALAIAAVGGLTVLAAALRFWAIGRQGLWYDESITGWLLRGSPGRLLSRLPHTESTPPLYYLVAWVWVRVFGNTAVGLRSLSAVAGVLTVPVTFAAARILAGRRVALFAALLVAVNPFLVWYSQEARSYALLALMSALSLWLFARARERPVAGRLVAWGAVAAAALCTHYFALFVVLPEALLLLLERGADLRSRLIGVAIPGVAGAALIALASAQKGRNYYFTRARLPVRVGQIVQYFSVGFSPPSKLWILAIAGIVLIAAVAALVLRRSSAEARGALPPLIVAASAMGIPILLAVAGADYLNARNVIGALVPAVVVAAAGFALVRPGLVGAGLAGVLAGLSIWMIAALNGNLYAQRPHWQQVASALGHQKKNRAILLLQARTWSRPLGFYLPHTWWAPLHGKPVTQIQVLRKYANNSPCPSAVWWGALCHVAPHKPLQGPPAKGFSLTSRQRVAGFEIDTYVSPHPIRIYAYRPFEHYTARDLHPGRKNSDLMLVSPTRAPLTP